jgi:hypothetical protein
LIISSAEILAIYSAAYLEHLIENINKGWNSAIPIYGSRLQPDYLMGFRRFTFTDDQFEKFKSFIGEITDIFTSHFIITWRMYFLFLTCEVKYGAAALDIADRQNIYNMTLIMRDIIELFKFMKREKKFHREIFAFLIFHDYRTVRIYDHYILIDGNKITFYRHPIHTFDFTALDNKEK